MAKRRQPNPIDVFATDALVRGAIIMRDTGRQAGSSILVHESEIDEVISRLQAIKAELAEMTPDE